MKITTKTIEENLNDFHELEKLYRINKKDFKKSIELLHKNSKNATVKIWFERLNYKSERNFQIKKNEILIIILLGLFSGLISKIPDIFNLEWYTLNPKGIKINNTEEIFYSRNISFIIFPALCFYYFLKDKFSINRSQCP